MARSIRYLASLGGNTMVSLPVPLRARVLNTSWALSRCSSALGMPKAWNTFPFPVGCCLLFMLPLINRRDGRYEGHHSVGSLGRWLSITVREHEHTCSQRH